MNDMPNKAALEFLLEQSKTLLEEKKTDWKFKPLPLKQFAEEHLKIELTDRQLLDAVAILGEDPERVFKDGSPFNILCLIAGKGSGKDFLGAVVIVYCLYILLCMKNPHEYLNWPITESIDMLIISYTGEQAREVSFEKVKQVMRHWIWLKQNFSIIEGDRYVTPKGKPEILILADRIKTWHGIRIFAEHSANESYEGYNVLFWIMSEACVRGKSLIKLADGREMPIADIVNKKLPVYVLTKNFETGTLEPRQVTNWFKYPRRSHLLQIRVGHSRAQNTIDETIQCTPNHHVFTDRKYVRADEVRVGDKMWVHGKFLSPWQKEFVLGSALGDASLPHCSRLIQFTHDKKQKAYLEEIAKSFGSLVTPQGIRWSTSGYNRDSHGTGQLLIAATNIPELSAICKTNGKKRVTREWASKLTVRSLAAWFMDDGSSTWPGKYQPRVSYYRKQNGMVTQSSHVGSFSVWLWCSGFSAQEAIILLVRLKEMGYNGKIHFCRSTSARKISRQQPYIMLDVTSSEQFLRDASPFMFPSMAYKTPFPVPPIPIDDSTSCELVTVQSVIAIDGDELCWQKDGNTKCKPNQGITKDDEWVYDIEVEHNHNYFAGDILVSNSAFKSKNQDQNGWKVFNTLRSSASTRFQKRWKGMIYSYIRFDERADFTWQMYVQAETDPTIYRDICYPWQFKPSKYYSQQMFDFEGVQVPVVPYQDEAISNPTFFRRAILCQVPKVGEKAIDPDVAVKATHDFAPLIIVKNDIRKGFDGEDNVFAEILGLAEQTNFIHEYLLTVDLGQKFAATAIALQHLDSNVGYVLDAVGAWTPVPPKTRQDKGVPVNMEDVRDKLIMLGTQIPDLVIGFDQWQSILYTADLNRAGIQTVIYHVRAQDYMMFQMALASGIARIPNDPELLRQLNALIIEGKEVLLDEKLSIRKDMVDATIGGFKVLRSSQEQRPGIPGATLLRENIGRQGGQFIPSVPR
jgi:hypothetical protein